MPKITTNTLLPATIGSLPRYIAELFASLPALPGAVDSSTSALGGGRTEVSAPTGPDGTFSAVVKTYETGPHQLPGEAEADTMLTGGTIQSATYVLTDETYNITRIGLDAATLLDTVDTMAGGNFVPFLDLVFSLNWVIVGTANDDLFHWRSFHPSLATDDMFSGNDRFLGRGGNDIMRLYKGNDTGLGGRGTDTIFGDAGRDKLKGEDGNDDLAGGAGRDRLIGGKGQDMLEGGTGNDAMIGGGGADTFSFNADAGNDVIRKFNPRADTIRLDDEVSGVQIVDTAKGVRIVHTEGRIDLIGITMNQIDQDDILGW